MSEIANAAAHNYVLQMRAGRFHGFVVRRGERAWGYVDRCPHARLPLARVLDAYFTPAATTSFVRGTARCSSRKRGCASAGPVSADG